MNCPITSDDVDIAEKIFGPDVGSLKGKSTREQPKRVYDNKINIPKEYTSEAVLGGCPLRHSGDMK